MPLVCLIHSALSLDDASFVSPVDTALNLQTLCPYIPEP